MMEYFLIEQRDYCKTNNYYLITESNSSFSHDIASDWVGEFEEENECSQTLCCEFR
jgi:hypothetical protein